jgi:hypothetical protein
MTLPPSPPSDGETPEIRIEINEIKPKDDGEFGTSLGMKHKPRLTNGKPVTGNFSFYPKILALLEKQVEEVKWDSQNKSISLLIIETEQFDAYQWISNINKLLEDQQKEPMVDWEDSIDNTIAFLVFLDNKENECARVKFKGVGLVQHECMVTKHNPLEKFGVGDIGQNLSHSVVLSYLHSELILPEVNWEEEMYDGLKMRTRDDFLDDEWKTTEVK